MGDVERLRTQTHSEQPIPGSGEEWQAWDNDVKEDIKDARAAASKKLTPLELAKELGIE